MQLTDEKHELEIAVLDLTGKEIIREIRSWAGDEAIKMNTSLLNGTYIVKIQLPDGKVEGHKLIIAK